jgi:alcohol dehydrogenase (cytochrome c)
VSIGSPTNPAGSECHSRCPGLATAGGLVFFGESGGTFTALDSKTGTPVWHFETGQNWRASPMTYMVGGTQYVVLAGDGGIFSFALTP